MTSGRFGEDSGLLVDSDEPDEEESVGIVGCCEDPDDHDHELEPVELDEDTFGMSICSLTRDTYHIAKDGVTCNRVTRLGTSLGLVILTLFLQIALLHYVKKFVSAHAVHDIREQYDVYEKYMYGCDKDEARCVLTVNGKHRGKPEFLPATLEERIAVLMSAPMADHREAVCHIPLSQPHFFSLILLIWTLTCFAELRKAFNVTQTLVMLPTIKSMATALDEEAAEGEEHIVGLSFLLKTVMVVLMSVPRAGITFYLLWVGCRWLLATTSFGDLILNAVALEFILCIKEALYVAVMPIRNHFDLAKTRISPYPKTMSSGPWNLMNSVCLLAVAIIWVYFYMTSWQQVLPGYKWDVHEVCVDYIKKMYAV